MVSLEEIAKNKKETVFGNMLKTRRDKHKWMLRGLKSFKFVNLLFTKPTPDFYKRALKRAELLESYYVTMRYIDDVVDSDAICPRGFTDTISFVSEKINFINSYIYSNTTQPKDNIDRMFIYCFDLARECGFYILDETLDILESMLFDAKRLNYTVINNKNKIFSNIELEQNFYKLDISGTIQASLKIFNEDPEKYFALNFLGHACRICYNLKDLRSDLLKGIVNIPIEECRDFNIPLELLESRDYLQENMSKESLPLCIKEWTIKEAKRGVKLIGYHKEIMQERNFSRLVRLTLPIMYEAPCTRYFNGVLASN